MSFGDLKISQAAIQSTGVQSQPDTLTGSATDNKLVFDALPTLIIQKLNSLLDLLGGTGAAGEMPIAPIDGMTATTVQQALAELRQALTAYINLVQGTNGAAQVGVSAISGMSVSNTQQALAELKRLIDNLVIGTLPPKSVTANMIEDGAIVQLGALLAVAAAAAYDPEGSYAVGDYCTHGGKLHKCGTAIPDGEAWNAAHWTETSVAAELEEVRASLSNKADRGESWVPESWMTIPVGKRLWFYTGGKMGYYILNNGIELSIYDHDNNNLLSLLSSRAPTINNGISLATVTPPQKQNISLLNGVQPTDSGCVFWKQQDNVCTVAIACTKPTDGLTPDMIIGTLPVGFRPSYIERAGYAATTAGQSFSGTVRIWSDGNVQIWFPNTSANIFIAETSFPVLDNGGAE